MTQRVVSVGQDWAEATGLTEVIEGVHNWVAVRFMTAPWDYSGILLLRILHEVAYFTHVADSDEGQKTICEKFIDEFLTTNRRKLMQKKPPLVYSKGITLAVDVVRSHNGRSDQLFNKTSVYGSTRLAKQYKEERDKAKQEKQVLLGENSSLRRRVKELEARAAGRTPRREDQRQKPRQPGHDNVDRAYREDRMEVRTAQKCVIPNQLFPITGVSGVEHCKGLLVSQLLQVARVQCQGRTGEMLQSNKPQGSRSQVGGGLSCQTDQQRRPDLV